MTDRLATYRLEDGIGVITMDDGKANALSLAMLGDINAALDEAAADEAVVVLQGRAGRFSAGFDLATLSAGGADAAAMLNGGFLLAERLLSFGRPVVAACTGHAMAMGAFLLLGCDHRVGAAGDFKVVANEVAIGLTMPRAALVLLQTRLDTASFHRSVMLSEVFTPDDAVGVGYLDEVVPPDDVPARARAVAERLATLDMRAYRGTKRRAYEAAFTALRAAIEADDAELQQALSTSA